MPSQQLVARKKLRALITAAAAVAIVAGNFISAYAATLTNASLTLSDPRTGETGVSYTIAASGFTTGTPIGCVQLDLGSNVDGSGSISGMDTSSSTFSSSSLITAGNWSVDNTGSANQQLRITHNSATEAPAANGNVVWGGITNGDTENTTYYGVLSTYTGTNCSTGPVDSVTLAFVFTDGELVTLTIQPTLTFTVGTVAGSTAVNGSNTTVASTGSGIDFGNSVTASVNGVSAHNIQVDTNANSGYVVYIRHSGDLASGPNTITTHTDSNATPGAFASPGTEAWGYTTEDTSLTGGTANRFVGGNWAGFTTSNAPVVDNPNATAGSESTLVGHQVGIASTTETGSYQTTIIYTMVATY